MNNLKLHDLEIERAILGYCLKNDNALEQLLIRGIVKEDFYNTEHQNIFEAYVYTFSRHGTIDLVLVASENKNVSIHCLATLFNAALSINIKAHCTILLNLSINRQYLNLAKKIQCGTINDIGNFVKNESEKIELLKQRINSENALITLDKVKLLDIHEVEKIKTGFAEIDDRILGFVMGSLNIITGYNGNGKSTLINQMCISESINQGYKVFAYSPELTSSNLKSWLYPTIAIEDHFSKRNYNGVERKVVGKIGTEMIDKWLSDKLYIYSDDSITSSGEQLLKDMEYMAKEKEVKVFIIDNLMKVDIEESYKNELLAQKIFVNKLKGFARKHNCIIHLVAHPRKPQQNGYEKISKFDIAGSGDITNIADYVMAIRRITEKDRIEDEDSKYPLGLKDAIIKIMKDRPRGNNEFCINLNFNESRRRFYSSLNELNKEYGYLKNLDIVQVEYDNSIFRVDTEH
jgi:replicative DNA helicase